MPMTPIKSSPASLILMRPSPTCLALEAGSEESPPQELLLIEGLNWVEGFRDPLVISPYTEPPHLLDLSTLEPQAQLLAIALAGLKSIRKDYATAPYEQIFNWPEVIASLRQLCAATGETWIEQLFYIVVFRSQIPPSTDYSHLGVLDKAAHAEAMKSGGFLKYWFGTPDHFGRNLATCVWRTQEDARLGGIGPAHRRAASSARHMYTEWSIDRFGLSVKTGIESWDISRWTENP